MEIVCVGLNHRTAPVELRERLAFSKASLANAYGFLSNYSAIKESFILSTCNRVEIYAVVDDITTGFADLKDFLSRYHELNPNRFEYNLYNYSKPESISHLFEVACGLDSMVLGETQILAQLKQAYALARENRATEKILNILFQKSFFVAKKVRTETNISSGEVSVSSVAVRLAEEVLGNLSQRRIMIIGAGKISELAAKSLLKYGASSILVSNRTYERAVELAKRFNGEAIRFDEIFKFMPDTDIVISSTCAPHFILKKQDILSLMQERRTPLFFIDLAVPRDIDPEISKIKNTYLYDIDDLKKISHKNIQLRQKEISYCKKIIHQQTIRFYEYTKALLYKLAFCPLTLTLSPEGRG